MAKIIQEVSGRIKDVEESSKQEKKEKKKEEKKEEKKVEKENKILEIKDLLDQFSNYEDEPIKSTTSASDDVEEYEDDENDDDDDEKGDETDGDKKVAELLKDFLSKDKKTEKEPRKPKQLDEGLLEDDFYVEDEGSPPDQDQEVNGDEGSLPDQDQEVNEDEGSLPDQRKEEVEERNETKEESVGSGGNKVYGSSSKVESTPKKIEKEEPKEICETVNQSNRAQVKIFVILFKSKKYP